MRTNRIVGHGSMKYMGSKRYMLTNGLGEMLLREAGHFERVVDLFCGAGSVARYVARNCDVPVLAVDLQRYATCLAEAVISRTRALDADAIAERWFDDVERLANQSPLYREACALDRSHLPISSRVAEARSLCGEASRIGPVWSAYGGYYFSPSQALLLDYLRKYLPTDGPERAACLAATLIAASKAASSPGHTAQPFSVTDTASPFIEESWQRDVLAIARAALSEVCRDHARKVGAVRTADAVTVAADTTNSDLVIVDPPYSAVQYSRFYHVLETIANGRGISVSGTGRYPPWKERPQSDFSKKTTARKAFIALLERLGEARASVIVTFPAGTCSTKVSGHDVVEIASSWFRVEERKVSGKFSTLGGNNTVREGRQPSLELLLLLRPLKRQGRAGRARESERQRA
jgi:adenine-specific DNA-methyltransferase